MYSRLKIPMLSILATALWGFNFPAIKVMTSQMPPLFTVGFRFLIMGCMLLPVIAKLERPSMKNWGALFILSLLLYAVPMGLQGLALQLVDASIVSLSTQLEPIVMMILGVLFYKERIHLLQVFGLVLAVLGVYFVMSSPEIDLKDLRPVVYLSISILAWAGGMVFIRVIHLPSLLITGYSMLFASVPVLLASFLDESGQFVSVMHMPWHYWGLYLLMSCFSISANFIYAHLIKVSDVAKVAPYLLLIPCFSLISGYFFLGETLELEALFGAILILLGVLFATKK